MECAHDLGGDPYHVPLAQLDLLVVEPHRARAADDDVRLLLLSMAVPGRPVAGPVAEVADAEVLAVQMFARETRLDVVAAVGGAVLEPLEVRVRELGHDASLRPG